MLPGGVLMTKEPDRLRSSCGALHALAHFWESALVLQAVEKRVLSKKTCFHYNKGYKLAREKNWFL